MKKQLVEKSKLILEYEAKIKEFEKNRDILDDIPIELVTDKENNMLDSQHDLLDELIDEYTDLIDTEKERQKILKNIERLSSKLMNIDFKYTLVFE